MKRRQKTKRRTRLPSTLGTTSSSDNELHYERLSSSSSNNNSNANLPGILVVNLVCSFLSSLVMMKDQIISITLTPVADWQHHYMTNVIILTEIVNFPFLCSNIYIPLSPAYGVHISQLIRYARSCSFQNEADYLQISWCCKVIKSSFCKFYGPYNDLVCD
jgi:hypothetical protein